MYVCVFICISNLMLDVRVIVDTNLKSCTAVLVILIVNFEY